MKLKELEFYASVAKSCAKMSTAKRKKVGAILVKDQSIISYGYNGTFPGDDNCCEDENNITKTNVIHAEANAILKASKKGISTEGSFIICTLSPCIECCGMIIQSGIKGVIYIDAYRDDTSISILEKNGIQCESYKKLKFELENEDIII